MQKQASRTEFQEIAKALEEKVVWCQNQYHNSFKDLLRRKFKAFSGFWAGLAICIPLIFIWEARRIPVYGDFMIFWVAATILAVFCSIAFNYSKKNNPPIHDNGAIKLIESIENRFGHFSDVRNYCDNTMQIITDSIRYKKELASRFNTLFAICYFLILPVMVIWVVVKNLF